MERLNWTFDEFKHLGVDFDDVTEVEAYDAKQGTDLEQERALVDELGIKADSVVVEIGCGTGAFAVCAAEKAAQLFAVDISKAMLAYVEQRAKHRQISTISYEHAGFLTYEHQGPPADYVVSK